MKLSSENFMKGSKGILEHSTGINDEADLWAEEYTQTDVIEYPGGKWKKHKVCKPSCIPISILCVMIFLVVLLPVLDQATEKALQELNRKHINKCSNTCSFHLVETIPEGLIFENSTVHNPSTLDTWMEMINLAQEKIDIASYYWTLRESEVYPDPSSIKGEHVFQALLMAGTTRGIKLRITQNLPTKNYPNIDTEYLVKKKAAEIQSLNFPKLMGSGVLHTKFWIIDGMHAYIGSANMDWRSLTQVKELGIAIYNCSCIVEDLSKIFDVYWYLGKTEVLPDKWPSNLNTIYNMNNPMNLTYDNNNFQAFLTSSPKPFNPIGRTNDIDGLLHVINSAEQFIYIAVMDYFPIMLYTPKSTFWPVIDDALKAVAIGQKVKVKMLISLWAHSRGSEDNFLRSLSSINGTDRSVSLEIRRFVVPANASQEKIPFARVNHNKYMVTDNMAFIGTSNWSGDYFVDTAGISFITHDPHMKVNSSIRSHLQDIFERDWNSIYSSKFH